MDIFKSSFRKSKFRLDWVLVDELAIGPAPRKKNHLDLIESEGIKSIFSLCSDDEVLNPTDMEKRFKCNRLLLPDHKSGRLPLLNELNNALDALSEIKEFGPVFIHCVAAMERSPLVCMGWLIKHQSLTAEEALDYMMQVHPGTNPLPGQLNLLKKLKL
tara:strand:+ start:425 stop:901 length:477 start_codon:yes stop_codon:yes gene_type:complete